MTTRRFFIRRSAKALVLQQGFALACAAAPLAGGCAPVSQIAPVVATASPSGSVIERVARTAGLAVGLGGNPAEAGPVPTAEIKVTYEMKLYGEINEESLPAFDPRAVCLAPHKEAEAK
jgi:hypothetical protein